MQIRWLVTSHCVHMGHVMRKGPRRHDTWFRVICIFNHLLKMVGVIWVLIQGAIFTVSIIVIFELLSLPSCYLRKKYVVPALFAWRGPYNIWMLKIPPHEVKTLYPFILMAYIWYFNFKKPPIVWLILAHLKYFLCFVSNDGSGYNSLTRNQHTVWCIHLEVIYHTLVTSLQWLIILEALTKLHEWKDTPYFLSINKGAVKWKDVRMAKRS